MEVFLTLALLAVFGVALFRRKPSRKPVSPRQPIEERDFSQQPQAPFDPGSVKPNTSVRVLSGAAYIVDGDTLVLQKTQVRLFGIDAPEIDHPYGKKAKWALVALCKGQTVRAEVLEEDAHGRTVAKCFVEDGRDLSAEMVKQGLAIDWPKFSGGCYRAMEMPDARRKLWLADARQKGRMDVWRKFEAQQKSKAPN